jgi:hypothetical protein
MMKRLCDLFLFVAVALFQADAMAVRDPSPDLESSCNDPSSIKQELERRLQYVIDADAKTLNRVAEVNPAAAVWLARNSLDLSQIAKGNEVNIEDGNSYSRFIPTVETVRLMAGGVSDSDVGILGPTFTTPPSGQVVYAKYTSTKQNDGTIQVHFESSLISPETKTTVAPLYRPVTFVLGPGSRELDVTVPGRPDEKLRAYPVTGWEVPMNSPRIFRLKE